MQVRHELLQGGMVARCQVLADRFDQAFLLLWALLYDVRHGSFLRFNLPRACQMAQDWE